MITPGVIITTIICVTLLTIYFADKFKKNDK